MSKVLYMDLDDTVKATDMYIHSYLKSNGYGDIRGSVYNLFFRENCSYLDQVENILDNWDAIPLMDGAYNGLRLLATEYKIIFVSSYGSKVEATHKKHFARIMNCGLILVESFSSKSCVDMSNGVCVDDRLDILMTTNARAKYEMYNEYRYNLYPHSARSEVTVVSNWYSLVDQLMEETERVFKGYENLRRAICSGI